MPDLNYYRARSIRIVPREDSFLIVCTACGWEIHLSHPSVELSLGQILREHIARCEFSFPHYSPFEDRSDATQEP